MDLDALAGVVAYKHTGDSVMTVTAAVDRITLKRPLSAICDLELSGKVTFATGRSSMEVSLQVAKAPLKGSAVKEEDILMTCAFTMVRLLPVFERGMMFTGDCNRSLWIQRPRNPWLSVPSNLSRLKKSNSSMKGNRITTSRKPLRRWH